MSARRDTWLVRFVRTRLTPAGFLLLVVLIVAGGVALGVGPHYPLTKLAALVLALFLSQVVVAFPWRPRVSIERHLPERFAAGARVPVSARVRNLGRRPIYDLAVLERLAGPSLVQRPSVPVYLERLDPGEAVDVEYELEAATRGVFDLDGPIGASAFPLGLSHTIARIAAPARVLVYPRFMPLAGLDLPVGRKHQPGGLALVSDVGDSGEFLGNREYRPGDRLRDVHHAAWARTGTPVVREFQQEYLCRVALVADTHVPARDKAAARALEAAISLGAAVAEVLSRQEYVIDVFAAGPDLYHFQAGRSLAHLENILDILACVDGTPLNPFETLGPAIQEELAQISTAVLVLLDWDEARAAFARHLEGHGVAVRAIVVREGPTALDTTGVVLGAGPLVVLTPAQVDAGAERL